MRHLLLLFALLSTTPAAAITSDQRGAWLDLGAGLGMSRLPPRPSLAGAVSLGAWWGPYDNAYAAGRFWGIGLHTASTWRSDRLTVAPMVEVRRGMDLFVVQTWFGLGAAPLVALERDDGALIGASARLNGGLRYRKHRFWSATARLSIGADLVGDQVSPAGELLLGVGWSKPGAKSRATP